MHCLCFLGCGYGTPWANDNGPTVDEQVTYIYDVRNLSAPRLVSVYESNLTVIDHNQYIIDNGKSTESGEFRGYSFQSNYEAGLRVINIDGISEGAIFEVAYFDSYVWAERSSNVSVNVTDWDLIEAERHDSMNWRGMSFMSGMAMMNSLFARCEQARGVCSRFSSPTRTRLRTAISRCCITRILDSWCCATTSG